MKTKKMVLALFLSLATVTGFAQTSSKKSKSKIMLSALAGLNMPRLSSTDNNEMSRDYTSRSGISYGLTASLEIGSNFALRADLLYSSEGGQRNGVQAIDASSFNPQAPAGTYLYANFNNESILNYAEIPLMLKYSIPTGKSSNFYVDFGPYIGFLLNNAKQKTSGSSIVYADRAQTQPVTVNPQTGEMISVPFDANTDIKNDINPVNFGLTGGVGYAQGVGSGNIFLDVRAANGLTIVQKDSQNGSSHIGNLCIALGYSLPL